MMICGVSVTPLKRISNPNGDIFHALKQSDDSFLTFGEAYFSVANFGAVKGWKMHTKMVLNLVVPVGTIRFVIYDQRPNSETNGEFQEVFLSADNYCRLTVEPGLWLAFQGVDETENILLNIASIEHDPMESINSELDTFYFDWEIN